LKKSKTYIDFKVLDEFKKEETYIAIIVPVLKNSLLIERPKKRKHI